jgi:hypothetical protein
MKLKTSPLVANDPVMQKTLRDISYQVNLLSEGRIEASYTAITGVPTSGSWAQGDFVRNTDPSEAGSLGSKYVLFGWICVAAGTPGTWLPCRFLTGN